MAVDGASWFAVGGVVLGAVLGYASSTAQEVARRRHDRQRELAAATREDGIRFERRRFDAYMATLTAANRVYGAAKHPVVTHGHLGGDDYVAQVTAAYEQFTPTLSPSFLLASSPSTRQGLAAVGRTTRTLLEVVVSSGARPPDDAFDAHRAAVRTTEAAMRVEFGLSELAVDALDTDES